MNDDPRLRVKMITDRKVYIHNDLANSAYYFRKRVLERLEKKDQDGIFSEIIGGLTMTAFAMEAHINFIGDKVFGEEWDERSGYWKKIKKVFNALDIHTDFKSRPYSSIENLQKLRDALAHGKPERVLREEIVEAKRSELYAMQHLEGEWEAMVTPQNLDEWYQDVDEIWKLMLEKSGIHIVDTITTGSHGMELIEAIED